ncbi:sigma factor [Gemmatimonas sp.]|uniref:sigma factor n=1 Tax=Gemmatimonas sp. TaxID=1962908 RepID=UPI00286E2A38|nr:sigma factor [Gemmatimonas sp.]
MATPARESQVTATFMPLVSVARGVGEAADVALERLLILLHAPIKRYAFAKVQRSPDADDLAADIAQDALIRIAKGVRTCRAQSDGEVMAWAMTIAHRLVLDLVRSRQSGLQAAYFADVTAQAMFGMTMEDSIGQRAELEPAMELLLRLMADAYNGAIDSTGELIWWRLIISLDWREIGEQVQTTPAGAKRRFQRAMDTLRLEVIRRVDALDEVDRHAVLALLARFGYAQAVMSDQVSDNEVEADRRSAAPVPPLAPRAAMAFTRRVRASRALSSSIEGGAVA